MIGKNHPISISKIFYWSFNTSLLQHIPLNYTITISENEFYWTFVLNLQ